MDRSPGFASAAQVGTSNGFPKAVGRLCGYGGHFRRPFPNIPVVVTERHAFHVADRFLGHVRFGVPVVGIPDVHMESPVSAH